jgi:hypothetical protein
MNSYCSKLSERANTALKIPTQTRQWSKNGEKDVFCLSRMAGWKVISRLCKVNAVIRSTPHTIQER